MFHLAWYALMVLNGVGDKYTHTRGPCLCGWIVLGLSERDKRIDRSKYNLRPSAGARSFKRLDCLLACLLLCCLRTVRSFGSSDSFVSGGVSAMRERMRAGVHLFSINNYLL